MAFSWMDLIATVPMPLKYLTELDFWGVLLSLVMVRNVTDFFSRDLTKF